jgi:hypothetical protein
MDEKILVSSSRIAQLRRWLTARFHQSRRRTNPYVVGVPVLDDRLFVGRDALLERIVGLLHHTNVALIGERRAGKTSVLHHLKRRLGRSAAGETAFLSVLVDLQGVPQERVFATLAEEITTELAPLLVGTVFPPARAARDYGFRQLAGDLCAVLATLGYRAGAGSKLVLLIDEGDELASYDTWVNTRLHRLFTRCFPEQLAVVAAAVNVASTWRLVEGPLAALFTHVEVAAITPDAASILIREPIRGMLELEPGVVERICTVTACRPYSIQKLCAALVNRAHEEGVRTITLGDVDALEDRARATWPGGQLGGNKVGLPCVAVATRNQRMDLAVPVGSPAVPSHVPGWSI